MVSDAGDASTRDAATSDSLAGDTATGETGRDAEGPPPDLRSKPWGAPTTTPFSCAPLPSTFRFARPGAEVPGVYARCTSFAVGRAQQVAVSPDGTRAALVTDDGIVRVIDIASRTVVDVLGSPRSRPRRVAFSPSGDAILTVAASEREATLWRAAGHWTPAWTVALPGRRYSYATWALGSIAFSPDGGSVAVSPGSGYFVLDAATGALRASGPSDDGPIVLDIAYGWGGRRIVIAQSGLGGHCAIGINGGSVAIRDADTLAIVADVAWREGYPYNEGLPEFRASPIGDLALVAGTFSDPTLKAFRLSDGVPVPPPIEKLPIAFLGDGARVLSRDGAQLSIVRVSDGAVLASVQDDGLGAETEDNPFQPAVAFAASADGRVVAAADSGSRLLRIWNAGDDGFAEVCSTEAAVQRALSPSSLSADGELLALAWGSEARILRRANGALVATLTGGDSVEIGSVKLSPDGKYLLAGDDGYVYPPSSSPLLFRTGDGTPAADLSQEGVNGWSMGNFVFSPSDQRLHANFPVGPDWVDDVFDLAADGTRTTMTIPGTLLGFSAACPVYQAPQGIWRACAGQVDPPVGPAVMSAVLSPGGEFLATGDPRTANGGATVWRVGSEQPIATISRRPIDPNWDARESPVAMSRDGRLLLLGTVIGVNCYAGPSYEVLVRDMQTGAEIDRLPPDPSSVDDDAVTIAYGPELWCAR